MGENHIDPKHAENNGTNHGKQSRKHRPSHSPERRACDLIRALQKQKRHYQGHSVHGKINFLRIYRINLYQGMPAEQDDCGQCRRANDPLQHAQPEELSAPRVLSRSIVLPNKRNRCLRKGVDDKISEILKVQCRRHPRDRTGTKPVDCRLEADIGDGKYRGLDSGRNADPDNSFQQVCIDPQLVEIQPDALPLMA